MVRSSDPLSSLQIPWGYIYSPAFKQYTSCLTLHPVLFLLFSRFVILAMYVSLKSLLWSDLLFNCRVLFILVTYLVWSPTSSPRLILHSEFLLLIFSVQFILLRNQPISLPLFLFSVILCAKTNSDYEARLKNCNEREGTFYEAVFLVLPVQAAKPSLKTTQ